MITGLRIDCGSVQSYFKIKSDITTFGKCFGGGFPIGIIALSRKIEKNRKYIGHQCNFAFKTFLPRRGYCVEGSKNRCSSHPLSDVTKSEDGGYRDRFCVHLRRLTTFQVSKNLLDMSDIGSWTRSGPVLCTSVKVQ